jgi:predicted RNase H-like nuclease
MAERLLAIGADGAHGGWLAVRCYGEAADAPADGRRTELALCPTLDELVALRDGTDVPVAVDMPMGLLDSVAFRPCDLQARELLGERRSSVFQPLSRPLLAAETQPEAMAMVMEFRKSGPSKGVGSTGFGLRRKLQEVDDWLQAHPGAQSWLYECHPELSFRAIADGSALDNKKTVVGQAARMALVAVEFRDAWERIAAATFRAKDAKRDDILDAYAACHSSLRVAAGDYEELGGETDALGLVMRMVF